MTATDRRYLTFPKGRLEQLLVTNGMSEEELADELDVDPRMVRKWLRGDNRPLRTKLRRFLNVFHLQTENELYGLVHEAGSQGGDARSHTEYQGRRKELIIGGRKLRCLRILHCNEQPWRLGDKRLRFQYGDDRLLEMPEELRKMHEQLQDEVALSIRSRKAPYTNNPILRIQWIGDFSEEFDEARIVFAKNTYSQYRPFRGNLDRRLPGRTATIRSEYFKPEDPDESKIPAEVSVNIIVVTRDDKLVIPQRSKLVGAAHSESSLPLFTESVGGGVKRADRMHQKAKEEPPSPFCAAAREAREELNIAVDPEDVVFYRLIIGLDDPAYCFLGEIKTDLLAAELGERWPDAPAQEYDDVYFVDCNPEAFAGFLRGIEDRQIPPICECAYWVCLLAKFRQRRVFASAKSVR